jgi:type I restriction enzyme, R subunit
MPRPIFAALLSVRVTSSIEKDKKGKDKDRGWTCDLIPKPLIKRPDAWRGVQPREQQIKKAIYDILKDVGEVERIFVIIKAQKEY